MKLEIGHHHPFEIRKYVYPCERLSGYRILYLSDLHFSRWNHRLAGDIIEGTNRLRPDIILLGGDYADSKKGLYYFKHLMQSISHHKNIFSIPGNHDRWRLRQVREIVETCNGVWLQNTSAVIRRGALTIRIDGNTPTHSCNTSTYSCHGPVHYSGHPDLSILCLHRPVNVSKLAHRYHLVFAGHLHGSQVVLWTTRHGLYPGRLIYKWNRLSVNTGNCLYMISKGMGDTLPLRYNCKKDLILVEL
jgi:predicted MPP superfamily phosphohydrolase